MIKTQYFLFFLILLIMIIMLVMKDKLYQNVYEIEIDGKVAPHSLKAIKVVEGRIYISSSYLIENSILEIKIIEPEKEIEIYKGNEYVKFYVDDEKGSAFLKSGDYYIPLKQLVDKLGGKYIWDKENKILVIDFY